MTKDQWIIQTTDVDFARDAIERSRELPVVVDFWATWCGPCRALGPTLEKLAAEADGKFLLVKAEVETNGGAAQQFASIRSPPSSLCAMAGWSTASSGP